MECIELNWFCKHLKNVRSSQVVILVQNWIKRFSLGASLSWSVLVYMIFTAGIDFDFNSWFSCNCLYAFILWVSCDLLLGSVSGTSWIVLSWNESVKNFHGAIFSLRYVIGPVHYNVVFANFFNKCGLWHSYLYLLMYLLKWNWESTNFGSS